MFFHSLYALSGLLLAAAASPLGVVEQRQSTVPIGTPIRSCTVPGVVALTFDDGPHIYTEQLLDTLAAAGMRATFFLNGDNRGYIYDYNATVERMINEGHQVASHTWSHPDLATLTYAEATTQMTMLEEAFMNILGYFPTYMRAPYLSHQGSTLQVLTDLAYHYAHTDVDTKDYMYNTPDTYETAVTRFTDGLDAGGSLVLMHDIHQNTVQVLVPRLIEIVQQRGLQAVTVGQCLSDPAANWYRTSR